jgi:hypothetical protein
MYVHKAELRWKYLPDSLNVKDKTALSHRRKIMHSLLPNMLGCLGRTELTLHVELDLVVVEVADVDPPVLSGSHLGSIL